MSEKYPVNEFVEISRVQKDVETNMQDLQAEFVRQPGLIYYYTAMGAKATRQTAEFKLRLEATEAKVASNVRSLALGTGEKLTEASVKEQTRLHPNVVGIEQALIKSKEVEQTLDGIIQSLRHKKDSLMMLGWMARDERNAAIEIKENLPGARSMKEAATKASLTSR